MGDPQLVNQWTDKRSSFTAATCAHGSAAKRSSPRPDERRQRRTAIGAKSIGYGCPFLHVLVSSLFFAMTRRDGSWLPSIADVAVVPSLTSSLLEGPMTLSAWDFGTDSPRLEQPKYRF